MRIILVLFIAILLGCSHKKKLNENEKHYVHIDGRDTTRIRLIRFPDRFYGEMVNTKPGGYRVTGEISGNVKGDTLIGDYHYTPYKWKEKKRVPFAVLADGNNYLEGKGKVLIYMGIPYYVENTLSFQNPKRIFIPE